MDCLPDSRRRGASGDCPGVWAYSRHPWGGGPFFLSFVLSAWVLGELVVSPRELKGPHRLSDGVYVVPVLSICTLGFYNFKELLTHIH